MAWKTRDDQKRKLGAIVSSIDNNLVTLKNFIEVYSGNHKQLADYATSIAVCLVEAQDHINKLKESF